MQANLEKFNSGWYGLTLGLKRAEIDKLIEALKNLKMEKDHFHFRSDFQGSVGVGDIEFYYQTDDQPSNLLLENNSAIYPK